MQIIIHRINTVRELEKIPKNFGVEVDVRSIDGELILSHDPIGLGETLEHYLEKFYNALVILNIKEDHIEEIICDRMNYYNNINYFILDLKPPSIIKNYAILKKNLALRYSFYEPIEAVIKMAGMATWVWIDYFGQYFSQERDMKVLKKLGLKICLASPELQGYGRERISVALEELMRLQLKPDAVCTKFPEEWFSFSETSKTTNNCF